MNSSKYKVSQPSVGVDSNWHVTDDADTCVAHCFGFCHSVSGGEVLARRIAACLNACHGIDTDDLTCAEFVRMDGKSVSTPAG